MPKHSMTYHIHIKAIDRAKQSLKIYSLLSNSLQNRLLGFSFGDSSLSFNQSS